eukprot:CAMPEP_0113936252 /NCGR_PEP_ID=MMETSP1339-20121228/3202_1 /TAXON_ID=94617 /ORGANISM="Fibrocapsa japonica" /LENGTH=118 /DNA_ID=CAMNT_0000938659 /DNA_START=323 /DNA_END=676 /DNA_ORIENTATION=- /assembly_acc=CAM_ASM_000762
MASSTERILSASASGISMANSSSTAITTSTASRESKPKSSLKWAVGVTFVGSTFSKFLTTPIIRSVTWALSKKPSVAKYRTGPMCAERTDAAAGLLKATAATCVPLEHTILATRATVW